MKNLPTQQQLKGAAVPLLCKMLETNTDIGLTSVEAKSRAEQFGFNEIAETKRNSFLLFVKKFWGPSAWMMEGIAGLSFFLHKNIDAYVALGLLFINAVIGTFQDRRAQQVVSLLKSKLQIKSRTRRDAEWIEVPARDLVPGDIVRLRMGDFVPADLKIISGDVGIDQSTLTGESDEKHKKAEDDVFSSSIIRQGELLGLITLTGSRTFYGRTVELGCLYLRL